MSASTPPRPTASASDPVSHPSHYTDRGILCPTCSAPVECITVSSTFNFNLGNVIKYLWRAGAKGKRPSTHLEDLKKAAWYLNHEIERLSPPAPPAPVVPIHDHAPPHPVAAPSTSTAPPSAIQLTLF